MGASSSSGLTPRGRKCDPTEPSTEHTVVDVESAEEAPFMLQPTPPRTSSRRSSLQPAFDVVRKGLRSSLSVSSDAMPESPTIPDLPVISPPSAFSVPTCEQRQFCPTPPAIRLPPSLATQTWAQRRTSRPPSVASSHSDGAVSASLSLEQLTIHSAATSQLPSDSEDELGAIIAVEKDNEFEAEAAKRQELEPLQDYTPVQPIDPQASERSRRLRGNPSDGALSGLLSSDHRYDLLRMDLEQHSVSTPAGYLLDGHGALWECPGMWDGLPTALNRFELIAISNNKRLGSSFTFSKLRLPVKVHLPSNPLFAPKPNWSTHGLESQPQHNLDGGVAGRLLTFLDTASVRIAELRALLYSKDYAAADKAAISLLGGIETFPMCHRLRAIAQAIVSATSCVACSRNPKQLLHTLALRGDDGMVPRSILRTLQIAPEPGTERLEQFCRNRFEYAVLMWRNTVHFLRHYLQKSAAEDVGHRSPDQVLLWTLPGKQPEQNE